MNRIMIGTENFKKMIDNHYYYIDKTHLIEDVFKNEVVLYTRPIRFGKTLNMSMLYYFFSNKEKDNAYLFDGLKITHNPEIMKHRNQYPVISISLKEMSSLNLENQLAQFAEVIRNVVINNKELLESQYVDDSDKEILNDFRFSRAKETQLKNSLKIISNCLMQHYQKKVIILIDEYDVPLQYAHLNNYYDEMVDFLKSILSSTLKTNPALEKGVLTGCLRIAKESIFTGLNNFTVRSIMDEEGNDCFGFTQNEIDDVLKYYHLQEKKEEMKEWYDGYNFSNLEIYNPWSSLNYINKLLMNSSYQAESFWANTSSNDIVREYIELGTQTMREEFEELLNDKSIYKELKPELTYREMNFDKDIINDDIYSFLLYTGYLKTTGNVRKQGLSTFYELVIPNKEVKMIYYNQFMSWFNFYKMEKQNPFIKALINEDTDQANRILYDIMMNNMSYYDSVESFYHGFMVGFLKADGYKVQSNQESGNGRFDIFVLPNYPKDRGIVIECKHSISKIDLEKDSIRAVEQIKDNKYIEGLNVKGYKDIIGYGISFYKKQCYITKE